MRQQKRPIVFSVGTALIVAALMLASPASAAPSSSLSTAISNCWDSVDGRGLASLEEYGMEADGVELDGTTAEYTVERGMVRTDLGDIEIRANIRGGVLFKCTLATFPVQAGSKLIAYEAAEETLRLWYGEQLQQEGYFETLSDLRFFGLVRCGKGEPTITSSAMSLSLLDPALFKVGQDTPILGPLQLSVFRTSPKNFEFCAKSGAQ